jgi:predicted RNase H-like HicB family nuclease
MTEHISTTQLIRIKSTEEYRKNLKAAAEMYLHDLHEEFEYCKGHQFKSQIPESILIKIEELTKAIEHHHKHS